MVESTTTVRVIEGLHTRPATHIAKAAKGFDSSVELVCRGAVANAKSSVKLMLLGVKEGEEVLLRATGPDEQSALDQLLGYLQDPQLGLGDPPPAKAAAQAEPAAPSESPASGAAAANLLAGRPGSRGTALGPAFVYMPQALVAERQVIDEQDVPAELERFQRTLDAFFANLSSAAAGAATEQERAILRALGEVAQDDEYVGAVVRGIKDRGDAAAVTLRVGQVLAATFAAMADDYMRARAEDVRGVTRQLAAALLGRQLPDLSAVARPSVIVATDLSAWEFAKLRPGMALGLVCSGGSATSHVAIMARTHGIPAVLGVPVSPEHLARVQMLAVDGERGQVIVDPDAAQQAVYRERIAAESSAREALTKYRDLRPKTLCGRAIDVAANLGSLDEIPLAHDAGAMGVGLFRTELLFMQHQCLPGEDLQAQAYRRLAEAFAPAPVIIRTLDIGGDKPVAGIDFPREDNPFLGWRGVRMCLDRPDIFKPQLRALLRAAVVGNLQVMIPMVTDLDEVLQVKRLIAQCEAELRAEGQRCGRFGLGIMIETPAAVLQADALAAEVSFFSIGTNDLTQYVMATDRANAKIAALYRTEHPAVMRAVELTCQAAQRAGIWVGVCGEAAGNPALIPQFIEMGVTELSMSPAAILPAKKQISELTVGAA